MQTGSAVTIGILADDLTIAADGAAPFVARGLQALIGRGRLPSHLAPVVAIDGGMRSFSEGHAGLRTAALIADLAGQTILWVGSPGLASALARRLLIAMKAGGFGDDRTLRRAIARLQMTPTQSDQG